MKRPWTSDDVGRYNTRASITKQRKTEVIKDGANSTDECLEAADQSGKHSDDDAFIVGFVKILGERHTQDMLSRLSAFILKNWAFCLSIPTNLDVRLGEYDLCKSICDVIRYIKQQATSPADTLELDTAENLYGYLLNLTSTLNQLNHGLVNANAMKEVSAHMRTLHQYHKYNKLVSDVVESGVFLIVNCAASCTEPELQLSMRNQLQANLDLYRDLDTTHVDRAMDVITIFYQICSVDVMFPVGEILYDRLSSLLSRVEYSEKHARYMVYYNANEENANAEVTHILACMAALAQHQKNHCHIRNILHMQGKQLNMLIDNNDKRDMKPIKDLLLSMKGHAACNKCRGTEILRQLRHKLSKTSKA